MTFPHAGRRILPRADARARIRCPANDPPQPKPQRNAEYAYLCATLLKDFTQAKAGSILEVEVPGSHLITAGCKLRAFESPYPHPKTHCAQPMQSERFSKDTTKVEIHVNESS